MMRHYHAAPFRQREYAVPITDLAYLESDHRSGGESSGQAVAAGILRTTWERASTEADAPVLKRLAKVDTPGFAKMTAMALKDCKVTSAAFGRCSSAADSLSPELDPSAAIQERSVRFGLGSLT